MSPTSPAHPEASPGRGVRGDGARRPRRSSSPPDWRGVDPTDLSNPALYLNRELSWLEFNQRVLAQAWDSAHPLLERVKFLGISGTNLDEFFMVRLATLLKKYRAGIEDLSPDGLNTEQQLMAIRGRALTMMGSLSRCWNESLRPLLAAEGVHFLDVADFTPAINEYLANFFRTDIFPVLTPLAFDPGHPFPYISNLSKNLAVVVKHGGRTKFARVKVPDMLPRFVPVPENIAPKGGLTFAFLEDVIEHNIHELFPGTEVRGAHLFRIIRDTDMVIQEDEADDLLETVDKGLKQLRYGALSLLEVDATMPRRVLNILVENFAVEEDVVVRTADRMGLGDWRAHPEAAPPAAEGSAVLAAAAVGRQRPRDDLRPDPLPGPPGAPPVRFVRRRRVVPARRDRRPAGRRDQDDALPDRPELAAGRSPDRRRRAGQAGGRARRAEGALRRAQQHRLGQPARVGRHPRRLRPGQPEDALQAVPGGAQGARRHPPLRARRHRQLQPGHVADLHRPRAVHRRPADRRRRRHRCSTT